MNIERQQINVGAYYVLKVDMRNGEAKVSQYHTDYTKALEYATHNFDVNSGFKMLVVEVQGIIQGQGVPDIVTSLTRRM